MVITLIYADLYAIVERSLSIIGKRYIDDDGHLLFTDITLGSRETELIHDYFRQAVIDLATETKAFISAESSSAGSVITNTARQITFWTDQDASQLINQVTASGQLLYNYTIHQLYTSEVTFPFSADSPEVGPIRPRLLQVGADSGDSLLILYVYNGTYYSWNNGLVQLTDEQVEALSDEQKADATALKYFDVDPQTITESEAGVYAYYNNVVYVTQRNAAFNTLTPLDNCIYYAPDGLPYQWQYGAMQRMVTGNDESVSITLTFPGNHNTHLEKFILDSCKAYCTSFAIHSWFTISAPKLSDKYLGDCKRQLAALVRLIYEKKAPEESAKDYHDVTGSVTSDAEESTDTDTSTAPRI